MPPPYDGSFRKDLYDILMVQNGDVDGGGEWVSLCTGPSTNQDPHPGLLGWDLDPDETGITNPGSFLRTRIFSRVPGWGPG